MVGEYDGDDDILVPRAWLEPGPSAHGMESPGKGDVIHPGPCLHGGEVTCVLDGAGIVTGLDVEANLRISPQVYHVRCGQQEKRQVRHRGWHQVRHVQRMQQVQ